MISRSMAPFFFWAETNHQVPRTCRGHPECKVKGLYGTLPVANFGGPISQGGCIFEWNAPGELFVGPYLGYQTNLFLGHIYPPIQRYGAIKIKIQIGVGYEYLLKRFLRILIEKSVYIYISLCISICICSCIYM